MEKVTAERFIPEFTIACANDDVARRCTPRKDTPHIISGSVPFEGDSAKHLFERSMETSK